MPEHLLHLPQIGTAVQYVRGGGMTQRMGADVRYAGLSGRSVYDAFLHALQSGGWQGRRVYTETVEPLYAQPVPVTVHVWEICRRA